MVIKFHVKHHQVGGESDWIGTLVVYVAMFSGPLYNFLSVKLEFFSYLSI